MSDRLGIRSAHLARMAVVAALLALLPFAAAVDLRAQNTSCNKHLGAL